MAEEKKNITEEELAYDWARFTIERLGEAMDKNRMHKGDLFRSLKSTLEKSGGGVQAVIIEFRKYGRYVDMGVGRGVPIGGRADRADFFKHRNDRGQLLKYGRKAKKWYSKPFAGQVHKLTELLGKYFQREGISVLENSLGDEIKITF